VKNQPIAVLHIPHSSREIPLEIRPSFILSDSELDTELVRMTDSFTDELFLCDLADAVIFPVSRMVVDPERFVVDADEPMSKYGMGAVYTKTSGGQPLRSNLSHEDRQALIQKYYCPHHKSFTEAVTGALSVYKRCLIVDCHSFPSIPYKYEADTPLDRISVSELIFTTLPTG